MNIQKHNFTISEFQNSICLIYNYRIINSLCWIWRCHVMVDNFNNV